MSKKNKAEAGQPVPTIRNGLDLTELLSPAEQFQQTKRLGWLLNYTITAFKFVHLIFGMLHKSIMNPKTTHMPTMGVCVRDGRLELHWNPTYLKSLTDEEAVWVFMHETFHIMLHHCTSRKTAEPMLWNIATDLAVNEMIPEQVKVCEVPKVNGKISVLKVDEYKLIPIYKDIQNKQTAEWYFDYFKKKMPEAQKYMDKQSGGGEQGEGGLPMPVPGSQPDDHSGWKEDEIAGEKVRAKVNEINKTDQWGNMSEGTKEMIRSAQIRRINWRNKIRAFFGNLVWKDRQTTRKRPNRRTGYIFPGTKRMHTDRYLMGADTSGSIDADCLSKFLAVMNDLSESVPVDMMQFDCTAQSAPVRYDRRKAKFNFTGRGGTDFQPVIDIVNKYRYKGVIFLTDGCAGAPTKPKNAHVLWVLPVGCKPPVSWGERIFMSKYT